MRGPKTTLITDEGIPHETRLGEEAAVGSWAGSRSSAWSCGWARR
jgi:hypothetical protein